MYKCLVVTSLLFLVETSAFAPTLSSPQKVSLATNPFNNEISHRHSNQIKGYDCARVGERGFKSSKATTTSLSSSLTSIIPREVLTSFLPASLGFYKNEYGVSYGYGLATACTALSILRSSGKASLLTTFHAASLMFYGVRLCVFLAIRLAISTRNQELAQKIEDRAMEKSRLSRSPFVLSCGLLYYGLATPLWFTSKLQDPSFQVSFLMKGLIAMTWFGFGIAALGDFTKTYVKKFVRKDEYALVTEGVYSILRHPNYTGEIIGWTANALCGLVAAFALATSESAVITGLPLLLSKIGVTMYGWALIVFVLLRATTTLEKRQEETYKKDIKYKDWIKSTWAGWVIPDTKDGEVELDKDQTESDGTGI